MPDAQTDPTPTPEELKRAFKAFRKRLKLTRLDAESSISGGPLSGGRRADIVAIAPPIEFPAIIWETLVKQGKLKPAGRGVYQIVEE